MALGLCCQWLEIKKGKPKNVLISRSLQLGRFNRGEYSREKIKKTFIDNLQNVLDVMPKIVASGVRSLRISSSMFPLFDKVDKELAENKETDLLLAEIGSMALINGVRITTHPAQFTVISSDNPKVVDNSIRELEYHAWMFDKMGLPQTPHYSINIHGGKRDRKTQLISGIERLNDSTRLRLTLENCEFAYSVKDLALVAKDVKVPICFDSHHHRFNSSDLSGEKAMGIAIKSWPSGSKPMTHLSNSKPEYVETDSVTKLRKHSDYLHQVPEYQLKANNDGLIDIEIEAKMKNLAIFKAVNDFGLQLN
tara:strand:- start:77936 stop:78859 length:924 start_codon:yes stop_codon:yes gene_type:complete